MTEKLRIVSKRAGFRRAGLEHPDHAVFHDPANFNEAQIAALKAEPMLIVDLMDVPDDAEEPGKAGEVKRRSGKAADAG